MSNSPARVELGIAAAQLTAKAERVVAALPVFLIALAVMWLAWVIGGWLSRRGFLDRAGRHNPFLQDLVRTTVRWLVMLAGLVIALEILGATKLVGAVLGTAGVLGVALGFAFKDILENYLAGVLMSLRQPFAPRDHVVIDGNEGIVTALTSRATILMTCQGNHLRLPNALVFRSVILNYTRNPLRRLEFDVGIGTGEDLLQAQRIGLDALRSVPGVAHTPPVRALVMDLADSSVQVRFLAWMDQGTHEFLLVRSEAIRIVKEALDAAGVDLPDPIYQIRMPAHGQDEAAPRPPSPGERVARPPGAGATIDTRRTTDLVGQIDADRREAGSADLLRPGAPRE